MCQKAQFVLLAGAALCLFVMFAGFYLVSNLHLSASMQALQDSLRVWVGTGSVLLGLALVLGSCVLAYDACQKYKQRFV